MSEQLKQYAVKFDALSLRERALIVVTIVVILAYLWWYFFAMPMLAETRNLEQQNKALEGEINALQLASMQITQRMQEGVNKPRLQQLALLNQELDRVKAQLQQKTLELIEPDDMFQLMQQMIFSDSKLKLTALKRKEVRPVFQADQTEEQQPEIYRHIMQVSFQGSYQDILNYIRRLEKLEWKLIWDSISLKLDEYPRINVEIEISTLSDSRHWVGL
jgi:MSHA biogenesis protein MshJ